jgi:hypothetical protein
VADPVPHTAARAALQRFIDEHFHRPNTVGPRMSIPTRDGDDDVLLANYIEQQRARDEEFARLDGENRRLVGALLEARDDELDRIRTIAALRTQIEGPGEELLARCVGCECQIEHGDSACGAHVTCEECGEMRPCKHDAKGAAHG